MKIKHTHHQRKRSKHPSYIQGNRYHFLRGASQWKLVGNGMSIVVDLGIRLRYTIELHADVEMQLKQTECFSDAIKIAEDFADQHPDIFASSLLSAAWRKEQTYDWQKLILKNLGFKKIPNTCGDAANKIGKIL